MSFTQDYNAEIQHLGPLFAAAEKADREFHEGWKDGEAKLGAGRYKQTDRYRETLERFQQSRQVIDDLVSAAIVQAERGDPAPLPRLVAYVALPGRYFRSGYWRATIWRLLKRAPLDEEHAVILRGVVLRQIETAGPEFREIAKAAYRLDSSQLRDRVNTLGLRSEKNYVRQRAKRLLGRLESRERGGNVEG